MVKALIRDGRVVEIFSVILDGVPLADRLTPALAQELVSVPDGVAPGWVVVGEMFFPPPQPLLSDLKQQHIAVLRDNINTLIDRLPDGEARYDRAKKDNLINATLKALAQGKGLPAKGLQASQWIEAVQGAYYQIKASIQGATSVTALEEIDVSLAGLEGKYGVNGTVLRDPAVKTADLLAG